MSERGEAFDAAVVIYEAAQQRLLDMTDSPDKSVSVAEYRAHLKEALRAQQRAHKALMAAWSDA
jgi:hypothetical protein